MKHNPFTPKQFTPTQYSTAEDKARFANQFVRFVKADFPQSLFPRWFYTRLSSTFGHIAHYDQAGFYCTFFTTNEGKLDFLRITAGEAGLYTDGGVGGMGICGDPAFTYSDVERVLRAWVIREGLVSVYTQRCQEGLKAVERLELARLLAKYP